MLQFGQKYIGDKSNLMQIFPQLKQQHFNILTSIVAFSFNGEPVAFDLIISSTL